MKKTKEITEYLTFMIKVKVLKFAQTRKNNNRANGFAVRCLKDYSMGSVVFIINCQKARLTDKKSLCSLW